MSLENVLASFSAAASPLIASTSIALVCFTLQSLFWVVLLAGKSGAFPELVVFSELGFLFALSMMLSNQLTNEVSREELNCIRFARNVRIWHLFWRSEMNETDCRRLSPIR